MRGRAERVGIVEHGFEQRGRPRRICPPGRAPRQDPIASSTRLARRPAGVASTSRSVAMAPGQDRRRRGATVTLELNAAEHDPRAIGRRGKPRRLARRLLGGIELALVVQPPRVGQRVGGIERGRRDQHSTMTEWPSRRIPGIVTYPTGSA